MPQGVYKRSEITLQKLRENVQKLHQGNLGRKMPSTTKLALEKFNLGHIVSDITKKKISDSEKGKEVIMTDKHRNNISKGLRGKYIGEKNWNWKGGLSKLRNRIRAMPEYIQWQNKIFKKEGIKNRKGLQVHHLKELHKIIEENKIIDINQARECKELWDIDNGVVLKKGEHYVITILNRFNIISKGFILYLRRYIKDNKGRVIPLK